VPAVFHGVLRDLVLAARDLAGPAWLEASGDDPDVVAFTALRATPAPPSPAECCRTLGVSVAASLPVSVCMM